VKSLQPFPNQVGSLSAQTVEAFTHRLGAARIGWGERDISSVPTVGLVRNPSSLSTRGGNPDRGLASFMQNSEGPLRFEIKNLTVGDRLGSKRIHYFDGVVAKDEFRLDPDSVNDCTQKTRNCQFHHGVETDAHYKDAIGDEERDQHQRSTSPYEVAPGPKGMLHVASIAGGRR